jgi:hypothetical protein
MNLVVCDICQKPTSLLRAEILGPIYGQYTLAHSVIDEYGDHLKRAELCLDCQGTTLLRLVDMINIFLKGEQK